MAKKTIIWSNRAESELKNVLTFFNIRNGNNKYGLKLLKEINQLVNTLSKNEFIGRLTVDKKTRVIVMSVYLIFYDISDSEIHILSFWDNRQDPSKRIDANKYEG